MTAKITDYWPVDQCPCFRFLFLTSGLPFLCLRSPSGDEEEENNAYVFSVASDRFFFNEEIFYNWQF